MAYGARYTSYVKGVSNQNYQFTIYEKDYSGSVVDELPTAQQPFLQEYNTADDDIFQPIVTTSFTLNVDITDVTFTLPDFTNTDDFKYYGVLFSGSNILFKGWLLTDQIQLPFTTGRKFIQYKFIDGLTMLKDIKYPGDNNINGLINLRDVVKTIFDQIIYPDISITAANGWRLGIICNIFGDTMTTKASGATNEPLVQSFVYKRTLTDNEEYLDCYTILERIAKSFAAQVFQAEGTWWFGSIVDLARITCDVVYLTSAGVVSSGTKTAGYTLAPYTNGTQNLYYVNNGQIKTVKKGFTNFNVKYEFKAPSIIPDRLMQELTAGFPTQYEVDGTGTFTASLDSIKSYNAIEVSNTSGTVWVLPNINNISSDATEVDGNVKFKISFDYQSALTLPSLPSKPFGYLVLIINRTVGIANTESYFLKYLNDSFTWEKAPNPASPWTILTVPKNECLQIDMQESLEPQSFSLDTIYTPDWATATSPLYDTGTIQFAVMSDSTDYETSWKIGNFVFEPITADQSLNINYKATDGKYTRDIELHFGAENQVPYEDNTTFNGCIVSNFGTEARKIFSQWNYYYSIAGSSQFISLLHFVGECQANNLSPIAITLDGEMQGVYIRRNGESTLAPFSYLCHIVVNDSASAPYSVNGTKYRPTRLNIDYKADIISATLCPVVALTNRTTLTKTEFYKLRES